MRKSANKTHDDVLAQLVERLSSRSLRQAGVIRWAAPVLAFGNPETSKIATLGINPSNREFENRDGSEIDGKSRRFHSLKSLKLRKWSDAHRVHRIKIATSCYKYFSCNPYDTWFMPLNRLLEDTNFSYYGKRPRACHLDLVPYATADKWGSLSTKQQEVLWDVGAHALADVLATSRISVLVLNGRAVVDQFGEMFGVAFAQRIRPSWALRRGRKTVSGLSFEACVSKLGTTKLRRKLLLLGYNHNIQSSFGVTGKVAQSIGRWVSKAVREHLA